MDIEPILLDLAEHFADLDDSEDAPFGEFARVDYKPGRAYIEVRHETEDSGVRIMVARL